MGVDQSIFEGVNSTLYNKVFTYFSVNTQSMKELQKRKKGYLWMLDKKLYKKTILVLLYHGQARDTSLPFKQQRQKKARLYCSKNRDQKDRDGFWDDHMTTDTPHYSWETIDYYLPTVESLSVCLTFNHFQTNIIKGKYSSLFNMQETHL